MHSENTEWAEILKRKRGEMMSQKKKCYHKHLKYLGIPEPSWYTTDDPIYLYNCLDCDTIVSRETDNEQLPEGNLQRVREGKGADSGDRVYKT